MPSTSKSYDDGDMDRSNSSESSFNAMSEAGGPLGEFKLNYYVLCFFRPGYGHESLATPPANKMDGKC